MPQMKKRINLIKIWQDFGLYLEFAILLCGMSLISAKGSYRGGTEGLVFFLFQIGGVLLPGMAVMALLRIKELTGLEQLLFSYGTGYCLNIALYFFIMCLGFKSHSRAVFLVVTLVSVLILARKRPERAAVEVKEKINVGLLLGILFVYMLVVFSRRWALPFEQKFYHQDLLYWVGDAIALKEKFVPINFRSLGEGYKYHYFGAMQIAVASMVTEISTYAMAAFYSYIESAVFMALTFYCVIKRFVKKPAMVLLTLFLMLFTTGIETEAVTYIWHLYLNPMSFNIALCLEVMILLLTLLQHRKGKLDLKYLFLSVLCLCVCTGMKGPAGAIAICTIGFFCIYWLLAERNFWKPVIYGGCCLAAFAVVYLLLLADMGKNYVLPTPALIQSEQTAPEEERTENSQIPDTGGAKNESAEATMEEEASQITASVETMEEVSQTTAAEEHKVKDGTSQVLENVRRYLSYYGKADPWIFLPAALLIVLLLLRRKCGVEEGILFQVILVGTLLGCFLNYVGASQMYFTMAVFPLAALLTGRFYEQIALAAEKVLKNKRVYTILLYGVIFGMIYAGRNSTFSWEYGGEAADAWKVGLHNEQQQYFGRSVMTDGEHEAYQWVRDHLPKESLLLSDRSLEENKFSYVPGVFTERHVYYYSDAEWELGHRLYAGDIQALAYFKDRKIDYILVTKRFGESFMYTEEELENIYSNGDVEVYKVL